MNLKTRYLCKKYGIKNYSINKDGTIDVHGDVHFKRNPKKKLTKIPIKFNIVDGNFTCENNKLTSFENFPKRIEGQLRISNNDIKSLVGCPDAFLIDLSNNRIDSLEGLVNNRSELSYQYYINLRGNPVNSMWVKIRNKTDYELFMDYDAIQGNHIIMDRLNGFLEDIGSPKVEKHQWKRYFKGYYKVIT